MPAFDTTTAYFADNRENHIVIIKLIDQYGRCIRKEISEENTFSAMSGLVDQIVEEHDNPNEGGGFTSTKTEELVTRDPDADDNRWWAHHIRTHGYK